ncbi:hypothetical protein, partial [Klebsiella aerogenes]|uniref:hypothetical protein n=1 Tax=Klebsiella aerogenes TaxID=548 RepID=UPI001952D662
MGSVNISQPRRQYKAHGLALLGRDEEALEALLPFSEIAPRYRTIWLRAVYLEYVTRQYSSS